MRFGVLTGGGDCPGLNAVIRAIVRKGVDHLTAGNPETRVIATMTGNNAEASAYASLFAAAPAMLAAGEEAAEELRCILEWTATETDPLGPKDSESIQSCVTKLRSALSLARGGAK